MSDLWIEREAVVTVKAYPNPSVKYHESVCVAAITKEEGWIRLFPVQFRSMPFSKQFKKYQHIQLRMKKHDKDSRPESYRPDEDSIRRLKVIDTKRNWEERRATIEPTLSRSMCEIQKQQKEHGKSLGVFRPRLVTDILIEDDRADWSGKKQVALDQLTFFDPQTTTLEKIPLKFKYKYFCQDEDCPGHVQSIIDWEIMELYRKVRASADDPAEIKEKIRQKYLEELCGPDRDTHFFVGNHSQHRASFMVLGVFWPPKRQPTLFD